MSDNIDQNDQIIRESILRMIAQDHSVEDQLLHNARDAEESDVSSQEGHENLEDTADHSINSTIQQHWEYNQHVFT